MEAFLNDTIACDTTLLKRLATDSSNDYNSDLKEESKSLLAKIYDSLAEWFRDLLSSSDETPAEVTPSIDGGLWGGWEIILLALLVIAVLAFLYYAYKKKLFVFKRRKKEEDDYEVVEDTIYGIDFDKDIDLAIKAGSYKEAVRLGYLQCLRHLSDKALIDWRIYKTPTQYTQEFKDEVFVRFTNRYVFLRYSGIEVTDEHYREMSEQKEEIDGRIADITPVKQEEGGGNEN